MGLVSKWWSQSWLFIIVAVALGCVLLQAVLYGFLQTPDWVFWPIVITVIAAGIVFVTAPTRK